ncbi:hypothetical protein BVG80_04090 [Sphingobacteriales bacterium TSM_CSM]|nr:hypothetical protein BVG80_04090 [Sphingobacteriales bacterium TSM_CSM]
MYYLINCILHFILAVFNNLKSPASAVPQQYKLAVKPACYDLGQLMFFYLSKYPALPLKTPSLYGQK